MPSRLQSLRQLLASRKTDPQRSFRFNFRSIKLSLYDVTLYILSINHRQFQFSNTGDYKGYISAVTKPTEMNIVFLEDDQNTVTKLLDFWDGLKFNKFTGIHYPKATYEDIAWITYYGSNKLPLTPFQEPKVTTEYEITNTYIVSGFYPINRDSISLDYAANDIVKISVNFNVDDIQPVVINTAGITNTLQSIGFNA